MSHKFEFIKSFSASETSFIFDTKAHPVKDNIIFVSCIEGNVLMLDLSANNGYETVLNLENHHKGSSIRKIDFLNSDSLITTARSTKIYDLNAGKFKTKIVSAEKSKIYSLKVLDENVFLTGDDIGVLNMYDLRTGISPIMKHHENEDYISDMDFDISSRILLTTSGDGHLSAFNIRTKKFIMESEPFDSGFQSVRFLPHRNKVVVGAEDGALNFFNNGEWGNISDRFPITKANRSQNDCSIDSIEAITDELILTASSDAKLRLISVFPNKIINTSSEHDGPIESMFFQKKNNSLITTQEDKIFLFNIKNEILLDKESSDDDEKQASKEDFFSDL